MSLARVEVVSGDDEQLTTPSTRVTRVKRLLREQAASGDINPSITSTVIMTSIHSSSSSDITIHIYRIQIYCMMSFMTPLTRVLQSKL
mmetsp:Transcript_4161/g.9317  ORF Transcript_4161/g.9317 Transcript_4161/m.9317 type:complete len:88 (+) Transcript_4161:340-603(+)